MSWIDVTMVRVYLSEHDKLLKELIRRLHDEERVRGATVFRAISGFSGEGQIHSASLVDLSLDLPLVVEFFDVPATIEKILDDLDGVLDTGQVVTWPARMKLKPGRNS